jgi:hypothetical protein
MKMQRHKFGFVTAPLLNAETEVVLKLPGAWHMHIFENI